MRKEILASMFALVVGAAPSFAQGQLQPPRASPNVTDAAPLVSDNVWSGGTSAAPRGWVSFEYLNWWITPGPVGVPLVTTGNAASPTGGFIGDPSTRVLFGNSDVNFGPLSGGRLSLGYWFDADSKCGMEASGFLLAKQRNTFSASSDAAGNPLLVLPFQTAAGTQSGFVVSSPTIPKTGSVVINTSTRLWGADVNAVWNIYRDCSCSIDLLAGFRYFDLEESLEIDPSSSQTTQVVVFKGDFKNTLTATKQTSAFDLFSTRNQFYGGQVGARGAYQWDRWSAQILGELALGSTVQTLYTGGGSTSATTLTFVKATRAGKVLTTTTASATTSTAGGIYTNPNNIGNFDSSSFSVIPQLQVKLGYNLTKNIRFTIGYDAMFWNNVERPGNQISNVAGSGPLSNRSSLWVQGFDAGLEFRW